MVIIQKKARIAQLTFIPFMFCLFWYLLTLLKIVNPLFIPSPGAVANTFFKLILSVEMWANTGATSLRMLVGFFIASLIAIPIGVFLGRYRSAYLFCEFFIDFTRSIPATSLFPLFLLILGVGNESKIAMVAFSCFFVILINSIYGVWNSPKTRILIAKTFRASQLQMLLKIILWDALPDIFAGLRNALSIALILAVVSEMFVGTNSGLGFLIFNAKISYDTGKMYAIIIFLGILGYATNRFLLFFENRVIPWARA